MRMLFDPRFTSLTVWTVYSLPSSPTRRRSPEVTAANTAVANSDAPLGSSGLLGLPQKLSRISDSGLPQSLGRSWNNRALASN